MNYFRKEDIGTSDIALLSLRYFDYEDVKYKNLEMEYDGDYYALIFNDSDKIPSDYYKIFDIKCAWFHIIDDYKITFEARPKSNLKIFKNNSNCLIFQYNQKGDINVK